MLLPIGLGIGTVTSLVQHLRKADAEESQDEFTVSQEINQEEITLSLNHARLLGPRNIQHSASTKNIQTTKNYLQGSVSPGGVGLGFNEAITPVEAYRSLRTSYSVIPGRNTQRATTIIIELSGEKNDAEAAKLAIMPSVIRSLATVEAQQSIIFVLSPVTGSAQQHLNLLKKLNSFPAKTITATLVIKSSPNITLDYTDQWFNTETPSKPLHLDINNDNHVTLSHVALSNDLNNQDTLLFQAAKSLRSLILQVANKR
ncbi:hypothetical protein [Rubritalea marina]|uniref:hypothetical protein n=1 Tax=Rubritalea marina TaxID=361055 RepID=UPI001969A772|nr:hypothetical protein [Rubritalea marina]